MNGAFVNTILFLYIAAFLSGVADITLNSISVARFGNKVNVRLLRLNVVFFVFVLVNFILFFSRLFVLRQTVHSIFLVIFDLTYSALVYVWCDYLKSMGKAEGKTGMGAVAVAAVVYFIIWLVLDMFFIQNANQQIEIFLGKIFAAVAESAILIAAGTATWRYFFKVKRKKKLLFLTCFIMTIYFIWFFIYDMDCVFRFIGPKEWSIYPFDAVIIIYVLFNIFTIARHYSDMWGTGSKHFDLEKDVDMLIEEIDKNGELTNREREVLQLMIKGKGNGEIAEELVISVYTVKRHVNSIFRKTGFGSRNELTLWIKEKIGR